MSKMVFLRLEVRANVCVRVFCGGFDFYEWLPAGMPAASHRGLIPRGVKEGALGRTER